MDEEDRIEQLRRGMTIACPLYHRQFVERELLLNKIGLYEDQIKALQIVNALLKVQQRKSFRSSGA